MRAYIVALGLLAIAAPGYGAGAGGGSALSPGQVFATDLLELHGKGWRLAELDIEDHPDTDGEESFTVVMVKRRVAEKLSLRLGDWGRQVIGYERETMAAPEVNRVYRFEAELFAALAAGPVTSLEMECGGYYLQTGPSAVYVDDTGYFVVTGTATGVEAQRQLTTILSKQIGAGDELVAVNPSDGDDDRHIDLVLMGGDTTTVRVFVDQHARVEGMEVRLSPGGYAGQVMRDGAELGKRLARAQRLRTLRLQDDGGALLTFTVDKGRRIIVDTGNIETRDDEYEGCGC